MTSGGKRNPRYDTVATPSPSQRTDQMDDHATRKITHST